MLIGIFISYGDTDNSGYDKFLETFNNTQADFKFYNIKANGLINSITCAVMPTARCQPLLLREDAGTHLA